MKESKHKNFNFESFLESDLSQFYLRREGETKIGEKIALNKIDDSKLKFVILGINEDLGPQCNDGKGGADKSFFSFLPRFLSLQSNEFLSGENIIIPGFIKANCKFSEKIKKTIIDELDAFVCEILTPYLEANFIPIIIGGGHNNTFPIISSFHNVLNEKISVVNCDPHADFRETNFRHSGNPFSFAFQQNLIEKYAILGLHQSYNNQYILDELKRNQFFHTFLDDYITDNVEMCTDFSKVDTYFENSKFGIELDLDAIEYMPSSAFTPCGISINSVRKYVTHFAKNKNALYLHLPEGAPQSQQEEAIVGKTLSYLVSDFIKNKLKY